MSLNRYAVRRDEAEPDIVAALEKIGAKVVPLDWLDLLVGWSGRWSVLEVKTGKRKPKPHQAEELADCHRRNLPVYVVRSVDDALQAIGATR